MKIILVLFFDAFICYSVMAQQKPIIDTGMLGTWPYINNDAIISKDGRYTAFTITNHPIGYETIVVQDVFGNWKKEFIALEISNNFYFSNDNKKLYWQIGDSLFVQPLGKDSCKLTAIGQQYIFPKIYKGEWIAYRKKDVVSTLVLINLINGECKEYQDVKNAMFDDNGKNLLLSLKDDNGTLVLKWIDLRRLVATTIWNGSKDSEINSCQFDRAGKQVAFMVSELAKTSVFYFKVGMTKAIMKLDTQSRILTDDLKLHLINGFSPDGKWLFVKLKKPKATTQNPDPGKASVEVWSYRDEIVHPHQTSRSYLSKINATVDLVMEVESDREGVLLNPDGLNVMATAGDYAILSSDTILEREYWWSHTALPSEWLVSLKDGCRKLLIKERRNNIRVLFSNGGHWLTWWDDEQAAWMSYEIATEKTYNISRVVPAALASESEYISSNFKQPTAGIVGWYANDSALLICDNYDIWKVDPACKKKSVNITGGYGSRNNTELRFVNVYDKSGYPFVYTGNESLLLVGFNKETKYNGFFRINLNKPGKLELLTMKPAKFFLALGQGGDFGGMAPVQGGEGENQGWIFMMQSATEYPNYYYTKGFKEFKSITNFAPHRQYNWLTTELISWTLPDGRKSQGVLYKPENLDTNKKYPVIFNYYEKLSYKMYAFQFPALTYSNINIPWFVSRGYLVFIPDIYYGNSSTTGISSGRYACNAVESAAAILNKRSYVDSSRMALQGHSFGGLETSYILTHSKKFAAAAENAGFTDVMSSYLTLRGRGVGTVDIGGTQEHKEMGHELYGSTPWERPALYLDNSPVWSADKVTAPLLIFHNKKDEQVQWRQGVEMYMALRRLSKPCWMLQYDNAGHVLRDKKDALDYTVRITQFFDHYLKSQPAPRWMTEGIPATLKQVENRYELDIKGSCRKDCKICTEIQTLAGNRGKG